MYLSLPLAKKDIEFTHIKPNLEHLSDHIIELMELNPPPEEEVLSPINVKPESPKLPRPMIRSKTTMALQLGVKQLVTNIKMKIKPLAVETPQIVETNNETEESERPSSLHPRK